MQRANPEALIWRSTTGILRLWLEGDQWDSIMNYDAFMELVTWFLDWHGETQRQL